MNRLTEKNKCKLSHGEEIKSRCEQCVYFGKASDAPETVEEDCMWQTCEDENCTLPCEKGEE